MMQDAIKALIMKRFDKRMEEQSKPVTNGHIEPAPSTIPKAVSSSAPVPRPSSAKPAVKRKAPSDVDDDLSDVADTPPLKKKKKVPMESDAALAARLQAEENSRARPTRGGSSRKAATVKKKTPKKKSASKVKSADDSDIDSGSGGEKKVNRSGAFHVRLLSSAVLLSDKANLIETAEPLHALVRASRRRSAALSAAMREESMGIYQSTRPPGSGG